MAQKTRDKIITTAEKLIMQTGNSDVTLDQIAAELGLSHAALYKHFRNKQALWVAVATTWFNREIIKQIHVSNGTSSEEQLHEWLWDFVNAKKKTFNTNPQMFNLNTEYIDNNPAALHKVLIGAYQQINEIMDYPADDYEKAEIILAAFSIFTLPNFKETWNDEKYDERFEMLWNLIKKGL
ncbi:TetR/AcrR family transcriptional regulator [Companilactobacillus nantensis]|uniref:Transcriptional regulator n=1 Tax=Companilactobacillus nantensis DSM 16982 TaxID=1423774 RepID=A0A0R1WHA9_9LACO|nr:TetR/AcrR family transcriptional regulator [Companilactobacillus nantensis]KRM17137.1 transcriptional regulator [Companilactobacillus nantensis DSM 16982]GEO64074.1 TetR family transcriptional regulator [Companilactobacillus nantensis]